MAFCTQAPLRSFKTHHVLEASVPSTSDVGTTAFEVNKLEPALRLLKAKPASLQVRLEKATSKVHL